MPTYDYVCNNCDHAFELFQAMSARVKRKCPACGEKALERLIGAGAAVIFKGSGFYETDYRSDSYKKAADAEGKAGKAAKEPKAEGVSDSDKSGKSSAESDGGERTKSDHAAKNSDAKVSSTSSSGGDSATSKKKKKKS